MNICIISGIFSAFVVVDALIALAHNRINPF